MNISDAAYAAGLFDGEGSVYYKKTQQKKHQRPGKPIHNVWVVRMELAMTDKDTVKWLHEIFGCGHFGERKVKPGYKRQWRWRVAHRDALYVAKILWPYTQVKLHKIEQIIDHYDSYDKNINQIKGNKNIIDLALEREIRKLQHGR